MALIQYRKAPITVISPATAHQSLTAAPSRWHRLLAPTLITLGSLLITTAVWPIVKYQFIVEPLLRPVTFLAPVPARDLSRPVAYRSDFLNPSGQIAGLTANGEAESYTDPRTWFPEADFRPPQVTPEPTSTEYTLAIPAVNIESARVEIAGQDLSHGLIQYPGTALPGQAGSTVVFGHSVLRQFYNPSPKNPNRYISIFSKIMTLNNGDLIYLDYGGIRYTYTVADKVVVKPEDVFILEQRYNGSDLKLITCVPEGTYLRRGVIIANLVSSSPI